MTKVICNPFVHRQTPDSSFSHFAGSWEELEAMAEVSFLEARPGYKDGVLLLSVDPTRFFTGIVELTPSVQLVAAFKARREGELPFIDVTARGHKMPAEAVDLVLYRKDILDGDASAIPADYEIVSINARLYKAYAEPMTPMAMARNFLALPGGTKADYTAEEFAKSIAFWSQHAMRAE